MKYILKTFFFQFPRSKIDTPLCSARRLDEVYNEVKEFLHHDFPTDYYNDHLNDIGDGSMTEV